jgi:hypothetical protein
VIKKLKPEEGPNPHLKQAWKGRGVLFRLTFATKLGCSEQTDF